MIRLRHVLPVALLLVAQAPAVAQPRAPLREIPPAFRGGWDETPGGCQGFEPRFSIAARDLWNFEVHYRVLRVRWLGRTEIEVATQHVDHDGRPTRDRETWRFRLVDNGRAIAGNGANFRRCARPVERD
ncbi:MAG TPA: hypothetical protein VEC11_12570 [Allosphingosinicella sp.]|nr:hypothetical protein [Allosphingosinicella sp.]